MQSRWQFSGLTLPPSYLARPQELSSTQVPPHPASTWESCDRQEHQSCRQKFPEGPVHSCLVPGHVSPDPRIRKELDIRPRGCACAGYLETPTHYIKFPQVPGLAGLVLLGPLHSEKCVHNCWLPLRVAKVWLLTVLLSPGTSPGWGSQTAGPGQWV